MSLATRAAPISESVKVSCERASALEQAVCHRQRPGGERITVRLRRWPNALKVSCGPVHAQAHQPCYTNLVQALHNCAARPSASPFRYASVRAGKVMVDSQRLAETVGEPEAEVSIIERSVILVNSAVVVRAYQDHVFQFVVTASRQPLDMMAMTDPLPVKLLRVVKADLAAAAIEFVKRLDVLAGAMDVYRLEEV